MKSKRRSSDEKKKANISVNYSTNTPTPEGMLYDNAKYYTKHKEYERYLALKQAKKDHSDGLVNSMHTVFDNFFRFYH